MLIIEISSALGTEFRVGPGVAGWGVARWGRTGRIETVHG